MFMHELCNRKKKNVHVIDIFMMGINQYCCQVLLCFTKQYRWIFLHRAIFAKQCHVISKTMNRLQKLFL